MKKERYEEPNISVYILEQADIVTLSDGVIGSDDIRPFGLPRTTNLEGEGF